MKYIAYDLGASGGKMSLGEFDGSKLTVAELHRFPNRQYKVAGSLYWDILEIYRNLLEGVEKAAAVVKTDLYSIGCDSYCNDFGLIAPNGDLINQMYCYRDEKTARCWDRIFEKVPKREFYERTGIHIQPFNTSMEMAAMVIEGEGYLLDNSVCTLLIPDLLGYFLTGIKKQEYTMASVSQLYGFAGRQWDYELMDRLGINRKLFPEVVESGTCLGNIRKDIFPESSLNGLKFAEVCNHDTASAVAAIPCNREHVAFISSGTWSIVGTEVMQPVITDETFQFNFSFEGGVDHRYRMLKNINGLWILQQTRAEYLEKGCEYSYSELGDMAESAGNSCSLIDPDEERFYMPGDMQEKIRSFCRETMQKEPETPGEFSRTILESLAFKYRMVIEKMEKVLGYGFSEVHVLGGGGREDLLNQLTADISGKVVYAGPYEASLMGNLMMQMRASGEIADLAEGRDIIARSCNVRTYEPKDISCEERYQTFKNIISHHIS